MVWAGCSLPPMGLPPEPWILREVREGKGLDGVITLPLAFPVSWRVWLEHRWTGPACPWNLPNEFTSLIGQIIPIRTITSDFMGPCHKAPIIYSLISPSLWPHTHLLSLPLIGIVTISRWLPRNNWVILVMAPTSMANWGMAYSEATFSVFSLLLRGVSNRSLAISKMIF